MFWVLLALALVFDFLNGIHDSSNVVATVIMSQAMRPRPEVDQQCNLLPACFQVAQRLYEIDILKR